MNIDEILARLTAELQAATGLEVYAHLNTESVIPSPYTEGTQQDWPVTATGKEPDMDDEVTITKAEYLRLLAASLELQELQDAGVDNWPGRDHVNWGQIQDTMAGARAVLGVAE